MSLPMTVSFFYALSRSGMSFTEMMRILAENDRVYGAAAEEVGVAVRNVEMFGADVVTSVRTMARRSPSAGFREFSENLASVLQTGGSLSEFLHREYEEFREEAEAQQERLLELIETLAEAYVTLAVAGPLFLIVILTVTGIAVSDSLPFIQLIVYAVIPLGNLGFIVYLSTVVDNFSRRDPSDEELELETTPKGVRRRADLDREAGDAPARATDGGAEADDGERVERNLQRLAVYKQWREVRRRVEGPLRTVIDRPTALLWVTFPLAVFLIGIRIPGRLSDGALTLAEFDDLVVQSLLVLLGTFAVAYGVHRRRIEALESAIPDFLDRLASLNEAGMTVVASIDRIRDTELGALDDEIERVWRDVRWGADVETALKRFERRVRTGTVSRVVTLTTEAMKASGNLGTVLRIAASQAKADRRLKRKRKQEMFTYVVVVYVAFLVFLFIIAVLNNLLLPSLPDAGAVANLTDGSGVGGAQGAGSPPAIGQLGNIDQDAYRLTFLHATVVQGLFSGVVAGQLSTGDLRAGAKHATVLVALGYAAFLVVL
jgi:flagellar protein FlaJ